MPDTVTSQIYDGARNVVLHINNLSDGTGQTGVTILDPTTLNPNPTTSLVLWRVSYDIRGGGVAIYWDAPTPRNLLVLGVGNDKRDFSAWGGIRNDATSATGIIKLSTSAFLANSSYSINLEFKKGRPTGPGLGTLLRTALEEVVDALAPKNIDVPLLTGIGEVGETVNCTMGNWIGEPDSYAYQFTANGITVASGPEDDYVIADTDIGKNINCIVTATNENGSTQSPPSNAILVSATGITTRTRARLKSPDAG